MPCLDLKVTSFSDCNTPFSVQVTFIVICFISGSGGEPKLDIVFVALAGFGNFARSSLQGADNAWSVVSFIFGSVNVIALSFSISHVEIAAATADKFADLERFRDPVDERSTARSANTIIKKIKISIRVKPGRGLLR